MNSESYGASTQQSSVNQESHGSAGLVKPVEGLAHNEEWIDCPSCQRRVKTKVKKVEGDNYQAWWWVFCLGGAPCACCITMNIPKWSKFHYSTQHRCPNCDTVDVDETGKPRRDEQGNPKPKCEVVFRTVKYNEAIMPMRYEQSIYQA